MLVSVIFGADALISGKHRVIVLKLILYLQPKMRYCGEQIVMKQMLSRHPYLGSATAHPYIHRLMLDNLKSQCFTQ